MLPNLCTEVSVQREQRKAITLLKAINLCRRTRVSRGKLIIFCTEVGVQSEQRKADNFLYRSRHTEQRKAVKISVQK